MWFMYELSVSSFNEDFARGVIGGGIIGVIGGSIVGVIVYIKMKKDINETIKEIEDMSRE